MPDDMGSSPTRPRKNAAKSARSKPDAVLGSRAPSPSARLAEMTRQRVDSLEDDKERLHNQAEALRTLIEGLQARLFDLGAENARQAERLAAIETTGGISSVLIALGGGMLGYAAYLPEGVQQRLAGGGVALLSAGLLYLVVPAIRRLLTWLFTRRDSRAGSAPS